MKDVLDKIKTNILIEVMILSKYLIFYLELLMIITLINFNKLDILCSIKLHNSNLVTNYFLRNNG